MFLDFRLVKEALITYLQVQLIKSSSSTLITLMPVITLILYFLNEQINKFLVKKW